MSLETDPRASAQNSQEETSQKIVSTGDAPNAEGVNRRGLMKVVGGGILGVLAVQEAMGLPSLAGAAAIPAATPGKMSNSPAAGVAGVFDVKAFGATGDGTTNDTLAINSAIDAAVAAGGGTVRFAAGTYASFSIHLKSNIQLYLGPGAIILSAETPATGGGGYDAAEPIGDWQPYQDFGHGHFHNSLIWADNIENASIVGPGRIWGKNLSKGYGPGPKAESPGVGNKSIAIKSSRNITLRDFEILQGGHFGILVTGVDNLTIDNLRIDTNRDGMDIDNCRDVHISNCSVNSPWDDAIVLKSSYALGELRSTDHVAITNCFVSGGYQLGTLLDATFKPFDAGVRVPKTGRIKCGTESNGGFRNIAISNCVFETCQGLSLESVDGALLEDVSVTNLTMRDCSDAPIFLRLGRRMRGPAGAPVGTMRRVVISNVVCSNSASKICSIISGVPGYPIEGVKISNVIVLHQGGAKKDQAAIVPPEKETTYPEPSMFGPLPANGFYIRHAKDVELRDITVMAMASDARPSYMLFNVDGADFFNVAGPANVPLFSLEDVSNFRVFQSRRVPDTQLDTVKEKTLLPQADSALDDMLK
jgi:polygalacturonase